MNAIGQPHFTKSAAAHTVMESVCVRQAKLARSSRWNGKGGPVASVAGSSATAKRTQRDDEDCIEPRKTLTVEAEALQTAAGNMCGTVLRGAPPGSETSSSRQGSCRNLGDSGGTRPHRPSTRTRRTLRRGGDRDAARRGGHAARGAQGEGRFAD